MTLCQIQVFQCLLTFFALLSLCRPVQIVSLMWTIAKRVGLIGLNNDSKPRTSLSVMNRIVETVIKRHHKIYCQMDKGE